MEIVNIIFQKKYEYKSITDKEKEDSFYIINKKFSLGYPKIAQFFNHKEINKVGAMDLWFLKMKKFNKAPGWYWSKSNGQKKKYPISAIDKRILLEHSDITEENLNFLLENYLDDVQHELKKLKRFNNIK